MSQAVEYRFGQIIHSRILHRIQSTRIESHRMKIDWYYHRKNCETCKKSQTYLNDHEAEIAEQVEARKIKFDAKQSLEMVRESKRLWVARGRSMSEVDMKSLSDEELVGLVTGRSGTLRAPAIRSGQKMFIGFHQQTFDEQLAG